MTNKQITIDYENICENYSKEVGCYNTFDGNCIKEQCFTYRLLQLLKAKEQECEGLKKELQAQRDFTAHEQKLIYCVAYDESCKTGNDCKQKKCIFKDNIKLKQTLTKIKETCNEYQKEYILNIGVEILTNKILQIIEGE